MDADKPPWRVTWGLDVVPEWPAHKATLDQPDVNCFRVPFPSQDAAALFIAEIQRYLGSLALDRIAQMDKNAIFATLIMCDELPSVADINRQLIAATGGDYAGWEERHACIIERLRAVADALEQAGAYGWVGER